MRDWTPNSIEKQPLETPPSIKFEKYVKNSNDSYYKPAYPQPEIKQLTLS
jgi:hypothetical protein